MLRSIKEIKKELSACKNEHRKDKEGRVIVDLRVINDESFLSPYSTEGHNIISAELSDFIEHSLSSVPIDKPIRFRIFSDDITDEEQMEYREAIHSHYADKYRYTCIQKKNLLGLALIMALVAVAALEASKPALANFPSNANTSSNWKPKAFATGATVDNALFR